VGTGRFFEQSPELISSRNDPSNTVQRCTKGKVTCAQVRSQIVLEGLCIAPKNAGLPRVALTARLCAIRGAGLIGVEILTDPVESQVI
jgi:hypothetical protein